MDAAAKFELVRLLRGLRAIDEHFPEARYDNDTIASTMLDGWVDPSIRVMALAIVRRIHREIKSIATEVAPTKS
ncbi:MAG: hypothetical protein WAZ48_01655 [Lysobacteraceae bacterium]